MAKWVTFFILSLLLLRVAGSRNLFRAISPDSDPHKQAYNPSHITAPPEQSRLEEDDDDDGHCKGPEREECLVRKTMVAHTDYIYTQDNNGP